MSEHPFQLLVKHQHALSLRLDSLEAQIRRLRVTWWRREMKCLIIWARGHRLLSERMTDNIFGRVEWLRWS